MAGNQDLKTMVDADIKHCEAVWKEASYDRERLEQLFQTILFRYIDIIKNFAEEIRVVSAYETNAKLAETYRENIKILLERLYAFQKNGYSNEGLGEYFHKDTEEMASFCLSFTQVRMEIGMMEGICEAQRQEINEKLAEMEAICAMPISMKKKWEKLRGYVVWLSGKNAEVAMKILPLFLKIR